MSCCPAHLQRALQGPESVRFLIDDGVLVAPDERFPEVVMCEGLLVADQRNSTLLYVVQHHAHLIDWATFSQRGGGTEKQSKAEMLAGWS